MTSPPDAASLDVANRSISTSNLVGCENFHKRRSSTSVFSQFEMAMGRANVPQTSHNVTCNEMEFSVPGSRFLRWRSTKKSDITVSVPLASCSVTWKEIAFSVPGFSIVF